MLAFTRLHRPTFSLVQRQMRMFAVERRFSKSHEWVDFDTDTMEGRVGITKFAAEALGDIVHVDLPGDGDSFSKGESIVSAWKEEAISDVLFLTHICLFKRVVRNREREDSR